MLFRHGDTLVARSLLGVGVVLVVSGVVLPSALVWANRGWMRLADAMSFVSTRVVLGLVFLRRPDADRAHQANGRMGPTRSAARATALVLVRLPRPEP